jgi:gluconolactonase
VDRFGRVIVGTIKFAPDLSNLPTNPPAGHLICMHKDGTTEILNDKVLLSNGLGTNLDGTRLFHVDSLRHDVLVYACGADGRYEEPEVFAHIDRGLPDGLTVSRDGHVLVALAYHGGVVVLDEHGTEIDFIAVPEHMTTSLCYGGPDLSVLYVVSGFVHKSIDTEQRDGAVYGVYGAGEGKPATRATVTINDSGAVDGT